jgi:hypothetical protein
MVKSAFIARKSHKWIALVAGIQALFWMVSGAYMVTVDLDFIHGDPLVRNLDEPLPKTLDGLYPVARVLERYPTAMAVETVSQMGQVRYIVRTTDGTALVDAGSGAQISPLEPDHVVDLARHYYTGTGQAGQPVLLTDNANKPTEIQTRPLPLWQVPFDDGINTTFYVSPTTGELITRRHTFWRIFDFVWMFHIMDFENRSDVNNNLFRVAAIIGTTMAISGMWLLVYAYRRNKKVRKGVTTSTNQQGDTNGLVPKAS